jgi:hypothetical protein
LYKESNGTVTVVERYNASNELLAIERTSETVLANGQLGTRTIVINAIPREQATTITSRDGTVESTETTRTLTPADNQRLAGLVSGLGELNGAFQQWQAGNKLQGVLQLSSGTVNILQATGGNEIRQSLGGVSASLGAINQLLNLDQVFGSGGNERPQGWGVGKFVFGANAAQRGQLDLSIDGESFGVSRVRDVMQGQTGTAPDGTPQYQAGLRDCLYLAVNQTIEGYTPPANISGPIQLDANAKFSIIAQRLPIVSYAQARALKVTNIFRSDFCKRNAQRRTARSTNGRLGGATAQSI